VAVVVSAVDEDAGALMSPLARFAGAPWAVVAAEDRELAEHAAEAISFHAAPEAARFDVETAPLAADLQSSAGDVDAALRDADLRVKGAWRWPFGAPHPLEPSTTLAWLDEDGRLVVRATTDAPFVLRARLAAALRLPVSGVRVIRPPVGAPFGPLSDPQGPVLAGALTLRTSRPVLLVEEQAPLEAPAEASQLVEVHAGFRDGRLCSASLRLGLNLGASAAEGEAKAALDHAAFLLRRQGIAFRLEARAVHTSLRPERDPRRTAGRALRFALEGASDEAARSAGRDPLEARLMAADAPLREAIERATAVAPWPDASLPREAEAAGFPRLRRGRGLAVAGPWSLAGAAATASLTLNRDGSLALRLGALGAPAGVAESLVERAATVLGTPKERISLLAADTDTAPAEDPGLAEPRLLARAVDDAAQRLATRPAGGPRRKAAGDTRDGSATLEADEVPAWSALVLAEVDLDPETGLAVPLRLIVAPAGAEPSPLAAWEDGQLAAAVPLVFGGPEVATALDLPAILRVPAVSAGAASASPESTRSTETASPLPVPPCLADLLPAAAAALAHALRDASGASHRALPVQPERMAAPEGTIVGP
jgi:CO/xanthine dehydrogenase Mo-binding subunit